MRTTKTALLFFALLLLSVWPTAFADKCYNCHAEFEDGANAPSNLFPGDVHFKEGLGCVDCHGGDPALDDMDDVRKSKGYKGVPQAVEIPRFCSSCHSDPSYMVKHNPALPTDQLEKYKTSVHGRRLLEMKDTKVANCVSCHSVHNMQAPGIPTSSVHANNIAKTCARCHADAEYMKEYGIPTDQYDKYLHSVHGEALLVKKDNAAPTCNDCHGNHAATPPGVTSLSAVCGLCHALIAENFTKSPHKQAFDAQGLPECEICHSNHLIVKPQLHWIGTSDSSLCANCHSENDGTRGFATAHEINSLLNRMQATYEQASGRIAEADQKGMMVVDEQLALNDVKQAIIQATTESHTVDVEPVAKIAESGTSLALRVDSLGQSKIDEYYFRRKGLGIATLLVTIVVVALFLKIRSIERNKLLR